MVDAVDSQACCLPYAPAVHSASAAKAAPGEHDGEENGQRGGPHDDRT